MRIHYLQHVAFEGLGSMEPFLLSRGHQLTASHLYTDSGLPSVNDIDWLIIMGGPMGIFDEDVYPWLKDEKQFIRQAIEQGKTVLGICLGAQLIADVLGAKVSANTFREIGWFRIKRNQAITATPLAKAIPDELEVFHWHGDTFSIPDGAAPLASSEACQNQGFIFDKRVVALQFHLETTHAGALALIANCRDELDGSRFVQTEQEMIGDAAWFLTLNHTMHDVLEAMGA